MGRGIQVQKTSKQITVTQVLIVPNVGLLVFTAYFSGGCARDSYLRLAAGAVAVFTITISTLWAMASKDA
jgi:hypothetical protein